MSNHQGNINVSSETGRLRKVLIHSPDAGLGKVVPSKAQDWLFEDIIHLDTLRKDEYDHYLKLLLYFLDEDKIKGKLDAIDHPDSKRDFYKPGKADFHASESVVELQALLIDILAIPEVKLQLVASVCAIEACSFELQQALMAYSPKDLAQAFICGTNDQGKLIFSPIPNFIFTRDIGIVINNYILLNKPKKEARKREALIAKFIFHHHSLFAGYRGNILELSEPQHHFLLPEQKGKPSVTLEGGDVMVVSKDHVLIGVSERTSREAAARAVRLLFSRNVVSKVTVVQIPDKRDYMHIDTVFTQVKKNVWVMLGLFANARINGLKADDIDNALHIKQRNDENLDIVQFSKAQEHPRHFKSLEDLLTSISVEDLGCAAADVKFIFSGNGVFPFDIREQWTDSCNVLALNEGVVLGYDRNDMTAEAFINAGFAVVDGKALIAGLETGKVKVGDIKDTLILMPSGELSRARGGFHCMSMPLLRD